MCKTQDSKLLSASHAVLWAEVGASLPMNASQWTHRVEALQLSDCSYDVTRAASRCACLCSNTCS